MQFKDLLKRHSDVERDAAVPRERPAPGKSVVIAERERSDREVVAVQVMSLGYVPLITASGERAIAMAGEYLPRLVIANLELDGPGGRDVLDALRSAEATRDIPVVLISNSDRTPDMVAGSQVGADDYICKPIDPAKVKTRIRELLLRGTEAPEREKVLSEQSSIIGGSGARTSESVRLPETRDSKVAAQNIERAEKLYAECCEFAEDAMARARNTQPPDVDRCRDLAAQLVRECEQGNRLLLKAIRPHGPGDSPHDAANVAIFSIKIGRGLGYDIEQLNALAMAALCHEVGMSCVPADVAAAEGKYSRKQWNQIRQHPEHAYKILGQLGDEYKWLAEAVYQEHERERGQGYPRGLQGDQICELAKIIGLADTYESLSHRRSFRKAFIAFDALREVIGMRNKFFAPHIIRSLVSEVSVFPLESYVLLNTSEVARVVRTNPDNLLRPVVIVERDASGQKKRPKIIDLAARPLIYVTKPLDERDLAGK